MALSLGGGGSGLRILVCYVFALRKVGQEISELSL
jgi:hypothetical protein